MASTEPAAEFSLDTAALLAGEEHDISIVGRSPWYLAWRRLRRNYVALSFLALFFVIVIVCSLAPVYARDVAHTGPEEIVTSVVKNGKRVPVLSTTSTSFDPVTGKLTHQGGQKILGPCWFSCGGKGLLGYDAFGRDAAVRLLYGGLNSLKIGIGSAVVCTLVAIMLALLAGYNGGSVDWIITRFFDLIWAFPVLLLAIALGSALQINGFHHFGISIEPGSLWIPTLVISYVLIPYLGRPLRGLILSLRQKEFVEAAIGQGASPLRIMVSELLPNIASSVLVFFTLIIASNILTEAGLSYLGAGVQFPQTSWGILIADGQNEISTAPWLAIIPGAAIVLTVLSLNVFGDGLRDALDPRAKVRMEH